MRYFATTAAASGGRAGLIPPTSRNRRRSPSEAQPFVDVDPLRVDRISRLHEVQTSGRAASFNGDVCHRSQVLVPGIGFEMESSSDDDQAVPFFTRYNKRLRRGLLHPGLQPLIRGARVPPSHADTASRTPSREALTHPEPPASTSTPRTSPAYGRLASREAYPPARSGSGRGRLREAVSARCREPARRIGRRSTPRG